MCRKLIGSHQKLILLLIVSIFLIGLVSAGIIDDIKGIIGIKPKPLPITTIGKFQNVELTTAQMKILNDSHKTLKQAIGVPDNYKTCSKYKQVERNSSYSKNVEIKNTVCSTRIPTGKGIRVILNTDATAKRKVIEDSKVGQVGIIGIKPNPKPLPIERCYDVYTNKTVQIPMVIREQTKQCLEYRGLYQGELDHLSDKMINNLQSKSIGIKQ
jgi:hypothetical protein